MPRRPIHACGLAMLLGLGACSPLKITDDTPTTVSVRYDSVLQTLTDATASANKACAAYGRTARLREDKMKAILEHVAHFDCVNG
jgi:hypothetical protein